MQTVATRWLSILKQANNEILLQYLQYVNKYLTGQNYTSNLILWVVFSGYILRFKVFASRLLAKTCEQVDDSLNLCNGFE